MWFSGPIHYSAYTLVRSKKEAPLGKLILSVTKNLRTSASVNELIVVGFFEPFCVGVHAVNLNRLGSRGLSDPLRISTHLIECDAFSRQLLCLEPTACTFDGRYVDC